MTRQDFLAAKPWWVWVIGVLSVLMGGWWLVRGAETIMNGTMFSYGLTPLIFIVITIIAGILWTVGGVGLLCLTSWGRLCLVWASSIEFARALLGVISVMIVILRGSFQPGLALRVLGLSVLWIGGLFWFTRFLRSDRVRSLMVKSGGAPL